LQMEEEVIFPAIDAQLTERDRAELTREMKERRKQG